MRHCFPSAFLFLIAAFLLPGQASSQTGDTAPTYSLPVQPLTAPVGIVQRAWPPVSRICTNFQAGPKPYDLPMTVTPEIMTAEPGLSTCRTIKVSEIAGGQRITFADDKGEQTAFTRSNAGATSDFSSRGAADNAENMREFENEMRGMATRRSVSQGDVLEFSNLESTYRQQCRVMGRTIYATRPVLVTDCSTEQISRSESMILRGRGYVLFDIETGVYLLSVERHEVYNSRTRALMGYSRLIAKLD